MIKFYPVDSSQMSGLGWDPKEANLVVQFNTGAYYRYKNVKAETVAEILFAEIVGQKFNALIKADPGLHPFEKITAEEAFA